MKNKKKNKSKKKEYKKNKNMIDKAIEVLGIMLLGVILPAKLFLIIALCIVMVDMIMAMSVLKKKKEKFNLGKLIGSFLVKITIYEIVILAAYWFEHILLADIIQMFLPSVEYLVVKMVTVGVLTNELRSINNHFKVYTGKSLVENSKDVYDISKDAKDKVTDFFSSSNKKGSGRR